MHWTRRALTGGLATTVLPLPSFAVQLKRKAEPTSADTAAITLEAAEGKLRLMQTPAAETVVWAYNGHVPGPLIRVTMGEELKIRLVNRLAQPTSLSWHGVRIVNAMDGVAGLTQAPVKPGESFEYRFIPPDAGVYWYHSHAFPFSAEQIERGLYGLLLVDEPNPPMVEHDLLLVLDDWTLDPQGQLRGGFLDQGTAAAEGRVGALLTVNSQPVPLAPLPVRPGARVRLRLLNVCAARIAILGLAGMRASIVAIDGQPSELFPPAGGMVPIGPGSRFEIIADMPMEAGKTPTIFLRGEASPDRPLMAFATEGQPMGPHPHVEKLPGNPLLPTRIPLEKAQKRNLVIGAAPLQTAKPQGADETRWLWTLNGSGSDGVSGQPLFRVKRGGAMSLAFVNKTAFAQQMHVHGHVFRVLHDLDDGWDPYWRESILIGPGKTKHVAFIADNPGKWALESLFLDRRVNGLAGWFEVS